MRSSVVSAVVYMITAVSNSNLKSCTCCTFSLKMTSCKYGTDMPLDYNPFFDLAVQDMSRLSGLTLPYLHKYCLDCCCCCAVVLHSK